APQQQKADPVPSVIAEAERAYACGEQNFAAGKLDAARQDLNRAMDILTQLKVDIQSDERLRHEFDKISDAIAMLGTETAKEPEGLPEQQPVPAPIDEANQVEPSADPNVKAKAEAEMQHIQSDLPLTMNDYVAGYINYFSTHGRSVFEGAWVRSGRYRDMIQRIFKQEGIPQDLIYLAQAESGFKPQALSKARARGMWQFMSSRGV